MLNPIVSAIETHKMVEGAIYGLKPNAINVFDFDKGNLIFPQVDTLTVIQIVFMEPGIFTLNATKGVTFSLGCGEFDQMETQPGEQTFDCQPSFMYYPKHKKWVVLSQGSFIVGKDEPEEKKEKKSWFPFSK